MPQTFTLCEHLMEDHNEQAPAPRSRVKRSSNIAVYIIIAAVIALAILFYLFMQNTPSTSHITSPNQATVSRVENLKEPVSLPEAIESNTVVPAPAAVTETIRKMPKDPFSSSISEKTASIDTPAPNTTDNTINRIQKNISSKGGPDALINEINAFYTHLDQQPYMQSFGLKESSKIHFSKLLQRLVDHPPVVTRETDDLYTLLKNTAHFFRIIGKDNINILKAILGNEQNSFERVLEAFYKLTYYPEFLKKEYSLSIPPGPLTDYAAFFLNTMGGRLYLFRRDSTSRMVVSYYAIFSIDRANLEGNGGHGLDIRPAILSLIEEIENGGKKLQLKDKYLDTLYDLQQKYY